MEEHEEPQPVVVRAIGVGTAENGEYGLFVEAKAQGIDDQAAVDSLATALAWKPDELGSPTLRMSVAGPGPGRTITSVVRDVQLALSRCSADELGDALARRNTLTAGDVLLQIMPMNPR